MNAKVEIVVTGRNIAVSDRYRTYVSAKLVGLDHLSRHRRVTRYDVELNHELNPRQSKSSQRVAIIGHGQGPTLRAEARGADLHAVFDDAIGKLAVQFRRSHDRSQGRRLRTRRALTETGRT